MSEAVDLDTLRVLRNDVHRLREAQAEARRQYDEALAAFGLGGGGALKSRLGRCGQDTKAAEDRLREAAVAVYREHGIPRPIAGIVVKVVTHLDYDIAVAKQWAIEHSLSSALSLYEPGFEKMARAMPGDVSFVTVSQEPTATVATDLGTVIAAEEQLP